MLKVALTGGIGTGKSYVLARFHDLHVPTIDADHLVHRALAAGSPAVRVIADRFGRDILAPNGDVDRRRLGAIVFSDDVARRDLEAILHPVVYRAIGEYFGQIGRDAGNWAAIADIPLLYETGRHTEFDVVVVTACDLETQVRRVMARDEVSEEEVRRRVAAQWPIEKKVDRADYVVWTGGSYEDTDRRVLEVYEALEVRSRSED